MDLRDVLFGINIAILAFGLYQSWKLRRLYNRLSRVMLSTTKENVHELPDRVMQAVFDYGPEWDQKP
jgi:hypothetical protein